MALTESEITKKLYLANRFRTPSREIRVMFLLPETLWRPLEADWWRGKEVSIIGGDEDGNYILRHCDGTVRLWDHSQAADEVLAPSVRTFVQQLRASSP